MYTSGRCDGIIRLLLIILVAQQILSASEIAGYNVQIYGAKGDGVTMDNQAIQRAIDDCSHRGGGIIEFPAGTYLTGTLQLRDNVILNLQPGSKILGSKNIEDYPMYLHAFGRKNYSALIQATDIRNAGIRGYGIIDGQGKSFQGKKMRPHLVIFVRCENISVEGVTLQHPDLKKGK